MAFLLPGGAVFDDPLTGESFLLPGGAVFGSPLSSRYGRPVADISAGSWLPSFGASLYAMLNEEVADDAGYIYTTAVSDCEVRLNALADPMSSAGHKVSFRVPSGFTPDGDLRVTLRQGSTEIAEVHDGPVTADTVYSYTLSGAEADAITDYTDLRIRFVSS